MYNEGQKGKELSLTRLIDAPQELVFRMWTDRKSVAAWWGPRGFSNPVCEVDARPGGSLKIVMRGPAGSAFEADYPVTGVFREIAEPDRLVFSVDALPDERGTPGLETLNSVTFAPQGTRTLLTLQVTIVRSTPGAAWVVELIEEGWSQSLDKLEKHLASLRTVIGQLGR